MYLSAILFVIIILLLSVRFYKFLTYKPPNFPPGPIRLPIWGSYILCLLKNFNFPHLVMEHWMKKYGPVLGMYIGDSLCVVTCDYETCKEVLTRTEFDGKPDLFAVRTRNVDSSKQLGIFFLDGPHWLEQRRFSLRHLRDYGFGRRFEKLETFMNEELHHIIEFIKYAKPNYKDRDVLRENNTVLLPDLLYPMMMNSIMSMFGMEPAEFDTERYRYFRDVGRATLSLQFGIFPIMTINVTPWLRYLAPNITGYASILRSNKVLFPFFKDIIETVKGSKLDDNEIRNFFDIYLNKIKENEFNDDTTFSESQLIMITIDYMFPSVTAITAVIVQILFTLLKYPDVRERMQKELDDVVGRGRLPTLDDRKFLPYTEAVIREVMRKETFVPMGIAHRVVEDTTLKGYTIPKDTLLLTSIYGAHMDEKVWGDPHNFRPERFIDTNGQLVKKDYSIPFGAGKRLCAGETFARNSLFLIVSSLYQNFNFQMSPDVPTPNLENKLPGIVNMQKDVCWTQAIPRD